MLVDSISRLASVFSKSLSQPVATITLALGLLLGTVASFGTHSAAQAQQTQCGQALQLAEGVCLLRPPAALKRTQLDEMTLYSGDGVHHRFGVLVIPSARSTVPQYLASESTLLELVHEMVKAEWNGTGALLQYDSSLQMSMSHNGVVESHAAYNICSSSPDSVSTGGGPCEVRGVYRIMYHQQSNSVFLLFGYFSPYLDSGKPVTDHLFNIRFVE